MVLVPATMELLGDRNWWFPKLARPDHPPPPRGGRARRRRRAGPAHRGADARRLTGPAGQAYRRGPALRWLAVDVPNAALEEPPVTEAVIVSAARTPIGRARKGSLVDVDAFRLAEVAVGRPSRARASPPPTSTTSCWPSRCRAAASSPGTSRCGSGSTNVPGIADNRHCAAGLTAGADRRRQHPGRHGPGRRRRRHREPELRAAVVEGAAAAASRCCGCRPATPRRPTRRRSTCRSRSARTPPARWA